MHLSGSKGVHGPSTSFDLEAPGHYPHRHEKLIRLPNRFPSTDLSGRCRQLLRPGQRFHPAHWGSFRTAVHRTPVRLRTSDSAHTPDLRARSAGGKMVRFPLLQPLP